MELSSNNQAFKPGDSVSIRGLVDKPCYNGCSGTVVSYDDLTKRWRVRMYDGKGLRLRPETMVLQQQHQTSFYPNESEETSEMHPFELGEVVIIRGLRNRVDLNGMEGTVVDWDEDLQRWRLLAEDGFGYSLKFENLAKVSTLEEDTKISVGDFVAIRGLTPEIELNGRKGVILGKRVEEGETRWVVSLKDGVECAVPLKCAKKQSGGGDADDLMDLLLDGIEDENSSSACILNDPYETPKLNNTVIIEELDDSITSRSPRAGEDDNFELDGEGSSEEVQTLKNGFPGSPEVLETSSPDPKLEDFSKSTFTSQSAALSEELRRRPPSPLSPVLEEQGTEAGADAAAEEAPATSPAPEPQDSQHKSRAQVHTRAPSLGERFRRFFEEGDPLCIPQQSLFGEGSVPATSSTAKPSDHNTQKSEPLSNDPIVTQPLFPGARAMLRGLRKRPELNEKIGVLLDFDVDLNRWRVVLEGEEEGENAGLCVLPSNLTLLDICPGVVLKPGSRVEVKNLRKRPEFNGRTGTIYDFEPRLGRWRVVLDNETRVGLCIQSTNLRVIEASASTNISKSDIRKDCGKPNTTTNNDNNYYNNNNTKTTSFVTLGKTHLNGSSREPGSKPDGSDSGTLGNSTSMQERENGKKFKDESNTSCSSSSSHARASKYEDQAGPSLSESTSKHADEHQTEEEEKRGVQVEKDTAAAAAAADTGGAQPLKVGSKVMLQGLVKRPELNRKIATAIGFEESSGRWKVDLEDGTGKGLCVLPKNLKMVKMEGVGEVPCRLANGVRVGVRGLKKRPELNGVIGTVVDFDEALGRWRVVLDEESAPGLCVLASNLTVVGEGSSLDASSIGGAARTEDEARSRGRLDIQHLPENLAADAMRDRKRLLREALFELEIRPGEDLLAYVTRREQQLEAAEAAGLSLELSSRARGIMLREGANLELDEETMLSVWTKGSELVEDVASALHWLHDHKREQGQQKEDCQTDPSRRERSLGVLPTSSPNQDDRGTQPTLCPGANVRLLNRARERCLDQADPDGHVNGVAMRLVEGRWQVLLDADASGKAVLPTNLLPLPGGLAAGMEVSVRGHGRGTLIEPANELGQWLVQLANGSELTVPLEDIAP